MNEASKRRWQALYVFGDSFSDSGAGYVDGNGPTAVVHLAASLRIPFTHASDSTGSGKSLNFAVSGAQTGYNDGERIKGALLGRGLWTQVADFAHRVQTGSLRFSPDKALFFMAGGLNDGDLPTTETIANLSGQISRLSQLGGKYFLLALLPTKIPPFRDVAIRLNCALARIPGDLRPMVPGVHIALSRWGQYFDNVMERPADYGILNTTDRCAGRALFDEDPTPCAAPDTYFYYHDGHPSAAVQRIVAAGLEREVAETFP